MTEWQPIETAPKDGTKIDVAVFEVRTPRSNEIFDKGSIETSAMARKADAYWSNGRWVADDRDATGEDYEDALEQSGWWGSTTVTHWMPIPKLPNPPQS